MRSGPLLEPPPAGQPVRAAAGAQHRVAVARQFDLELEAQRGRGEALGELVVQVGGAALARQRDGQRVAPGERPPGPARPAAVAPLSSRRNAWTAW